MKNIWKLIIAVVIPLGIGGIGSFFTTPEINTWYAEIQRSSLTPPDWVFGPVWTLLYIMMGLALFLIWKAKKENNVAIVAFGIQLGLNLLWSIIFFGWHRPGWALVDIGLLIIAVIVTMISFWKISRGASLLLLPYLIWISFASYLNLMIWKLN